MTRSPEIWSGMLGVERFQLAVVISREAHETLDVAASRVWTAIECLKKAGAGVDAPLVFARIEPDGWVLLASGALKIASRVVRTDGESEHLAIAVAVGEAPLTLGQPAATNFAEALLTGGSDARV